MTTSADPIIEPLQALAVPLADLSPDPANARTHDRANLDAIKGSLRAYGQRKPVVVNRRTGLIEAGNGTLAAARELGWSHLAVVSVDDDPNTAAGYSIADNRTAELAGWDTDALDNLLREVQTGDDDLAAMLDDLAAEYELASAAPPVPGGGGDEFDATPEETGPTRTKPGELWVIGGKHRLLVGDCTITENIARLMGREKAVLCNTDPPYGVAYSDAVRLAAERASGRPQRERRWVDGAIENDVPDGPKLQAFLESYIRVALPYLADNAAWYMWHPMLTQGAFFAAAAAADILIHRQIIWVKPGLLFGFGDYHWKHELCFYGWRRGYRPEFYGQRNQTTVWECGQDSPAKDREHPTQKPLELFARPIANHTAPEQVVYEPFGGSGSQFIAAHRLGRRCYGCEIEPRYADVILKRAEAEGLTVERE